MKRVAVGIIGMGTVGTGTLKIIQRERAALYKKTSIMIDVTRVCDTDIHKTFDFPFERERLTADHRDIVTDPDIAVVVESVGGTDEAKDIVLSALKNGKHVVTANKALIAQFGKELFHLAREKNVSIWYEASVAGAVPIIGAMKNGLVANPISSIQAILNGTTNYILTEMSVSGKPFAEALKTAQTLGYAEHNAHLDVDGTDAAHKICILSSIAYGGCLQFSKVPRKGINGITNADLHCAKAMDMQIKLIAESKKTQDGIAIGVEPMLIQEDEALARINKAFNAVQVTGDYCGKMVFSGLGAGMDATGSAVVSDILRCAREIGAKFLSVGDFHSNCDNELNVIPLHDLPAAYFIRCNKNELDYTDELLGESGIGVAKRASTGEYGMLITKFTDFTALTKTLSGRQGYAVYRVMGE